MSLRGSQTRRRAQRAPRLRLPARPNLYREQLAWRQGVERVAGVDEAGRGAWAGPLVGAAVVIPRDGAVRRRLSTLLKRSGLEVRDSKLLTHEQRCHIYEIIRDLGLSYAVATVSVEQVDRLGLGVANPLALALAAQAIVPRPDYALVDAFHVPQLEIPCEPVVKGDCRCLSIALASVVAKVERDRMMVELDRALPGYGFARHKGYGTAEHRRAIAELGVSPVHRRSFGPVAALCCDV